LIIIVPMRLLLLLLAAPLAAWSQVCPPQQQQTVRFAPGESLQFRLDALGADVGSFDVHVESAPAAERPRAALLLRSRAKTSAFVSTNVVRYEAFASVLLSPSFLPLRYKEDIDDGAVHKAQEVDFPPASGSLSVRATKNGEPDPFQIAAGAGVREILSTLYLLRAQPLKPGQPVCVEVFAGRKIWRLEGKFAARETLDTPLGRFATVRMDATAVRTDDANVKRAAHVWVSDDERRLPLVAIGEVRGKVLRAQLVDATGLPKRRVAQDGRRIGR
jgi:hypothetical protein